jgi:integrase
VATPDRLREGNGFYFSVDDSQGKETALRFHVRRRSSASGRKERRSAHRRRSTIRTSQPSPFLKQLAGEQGESRTETVQGILRHSKIQTTLDLYTQDDSDETRAAQGEFLSAVGMTTTVQ